jgi:hypothetical protein
MTPSLRKEYIVSEVQTDPVVKMTQENKAALSALIANVNSRKHLNLTLGDVISEAGGYMHYELGSPEDVGIIFYVLSDDNAISALINRIPSRNTDRDILFPQQYYPDLIKIQNMFGLDWRVESGNLKGNEFSYKGKDGTQKLVFSYAVSYLLKHYFPMFKYDYRNQFSVKVEDRKYLLEGDVLHFIMCKGGSPFISGGVEKIKFTYFDLVINVSKGVGGKTKVGEGYAPCICPSIRKKRSKERTVVQDQEIDLD